MVAQGSVVDELHRKANGVRHGGAVVQGPRFGADERPSCRQSHGDHAATEDAGLTAGLRVTVAQPITATNNVYPRSYQGAKVLPGDILTTSDN